MTLHLTNTTVRSGQAGGATATVTNNGSHAVEFDVGQPYYQQAIVIDRNSGRHLSGSFGTDAFPNDEHISVAPGHSQQISVAFITRTCGDTSLDGRALPPGLYRVRVVLLWSTSSSSAGGYRAGRWITAFSDTMPLRVTA
jgi:hypothetical protein